MRQITYHTFGSVLLRPYSTKADDAMETSHGWVYRAIGHGSTALVGYPPVSTLRDFQYYPKRVTSGALDDWVCDHPVIFGFTVELWDPPGRADSLRRQVLLGQP